MDRVPGRPVLAAAGAGRARLHRLGAGRRVAGNRAHSWLRPVLPRRELGVGRWCRGGPCPSQRGGFLHHRGGRHHLLDHHRRTDARLEPDGSAAPAQLRARRPQPTRARHLPRHLRLRADGAANGAHRRGGDLRPASRRLGRGVARAGLPRDAGLVRPSRRHQHQRRDGCRRRPPRPLRGSRGADPRRGRRPAACAGTARRRGRAGGRRLPAGGRHGGPRRVGT